MSAILSAAVDDVLEIAAAQAAARLAWDSDDEAQAANLPDTGTSIFANAFLEELILLQASSPGILRRLVRGANRGAKTLNVDRLQGLTEVMQNGDDVGASSVRFCLRTVIGGRQQLLVAHNGARIRSGNVVPMALPFISTKSDDAVANGRFGIGLKTLRRIADTVTIHGAPYHFTVTQHQLAIAPPEADILHLYEAANDTLLVLDLKDGIESSLFSDWFAGWEGESLLFLRHIDSLRWVSSDGTPGRTVTVERTPWQSSPFEPDLPGCKILERRQVASIDAIWTVWRASVMVPEGLARDDKATGESVDVSIAFPQVPRPSHLYARFKIRIVSTLACAIDAPFDPDTARENLIEDDGWNVWLISQTSALLQAVAMGLLQCDPPRAWAAIPAPDEVVDFDHQGWLHASFLAALSRVRAAIADRGLVRIDGGVVPLAQISYEHLAFADLLDEPLLKTLQPSFVPLPLPTRDADHRWRKVLGTLGIGREVAVADVLQGFAGGQFAGCDSNWWITAGAATIAAANRAGLQAELIDLPFLLDESLVPVAPHSSDSARWLVPAGVPSVFEARWKLFPRLHPDYRLPAGEPILAWLLQHAAYGESPSPAAELRAFAQRFVRDPIEVSYEDLRDIRDRFDLLEDEDAQAIGVLVGKAILLRGFHYEEERSQPKLMRPCDAYLGKTLDKEHPYWPQAAATTNGINWIGARYDEELKTTIRAAQRRGAGSRASRGPRRFLMLLGAAVAPRRETLLNQWSNTTRNVDLMAANADHVEYDVSFPDLEKVLAHMGRQGKRRAAERGVALLRMLSRYWEPVFELVQQVPAWKNMRVYRHGRGTVAARWLVTLRSTAWLVVGDGRRVFPENAVVKSDQTIVRFPAADCIPGVTLAEVDSAMAEALGIVTTIRVSDLLKQLQELQESGKEDAHVLAQTRDCYRALSVMCPKKASALDSKTLIGDRSVLQVRRAFNLGSGLIAVPDKSGRVLWRLPGTLLRGADIFHDALRFAPGGEAYTNLWALLNMRTVSAPDCLDACREIAQRYTTQQATGALIDIYRSLPPLLSAPDKNLKERFKRLPLACGSTWKTKRPVYLVEDTMLRRELARVAPNLALWDPPCDVAGLDALLQVAGVQRLELSLSVADDRPLGVAGARAVRERFECAVDCLADELARHDPTTRAAMVLDWDSLRGAELYVYPEPVLIRVACALLPQGAVEVRLAAFWDEAAQALHASEEALSLRHGVARALSQLFPPPTRHAVEAEWVVAWQASADAAPERIRLWDDEQAARRREEEAARMAAAAAAGGKGKVKVTPPRSRGPSVTQRTLKDDVGHMGEARPFDGSPPGGEEGSSTGTSANGGKGDGARKKGQLRQDEPPLKGGQDEGNRGRTAAGYSPLDLEQRGWELLAHALAQEEVNTLKDFRSRRGVGADATINWKEFVELKSTGCSAQAQVELSATEYARAKQCGADFILALVYGLENGYASEVRLIRDPLRYCRAEPVGSVRLSGLLGAPAVLVPFGSHDSAQGGETEGGEE